MLPICCVVHISHESRVTRRPGIAAREGVAVSEATKTQSDTRASLTESPCDERGELHAGTIERNEYGQ